MIIASAVATCSPTMNVRYGDSEVATFQVLRAAAAGQRRYQDVVPEAGDREQLADALDQADHAGPGIAGKSARVRSPGESRSTARPRRPVKLLVGRVGLEPTTGGL